MAEKKIVGFGGKFFELKSDCVIEEEKITGDFEEVFPLSALSFADLKAMYEHSIDFKLCAQLKGEIDKRLKLKYF